jgi:hypothetical protein
LKPYGIVRIKPCEDLAVRTAELAFRAIEFGARRGHIGTKRCIATGSTQRGAGTKRF